MALSCQLALTGWQKIPCNENPTAVDCADSADLRPNTPGAYLLPNRSNACCMILPAISLPLIPLYGLRHHLSAFLQYQ